MFRKQLSQLTIDLSPPDSSNVSIYYIIFYIFISAFFLSCSLSSWRHNKKVELVYSPNIATDSSKMRKTAKNYRVTTPASPRPSSTSFTTLPSFASPQSTSSSSSSSFSHGLISPPPVHSLLSPPPHSLTPSQYSLTSPVPNPSFDSPVAGESNQSNQLFSTQFQSPQSLKSSQSNLSNPSPKSNRSTNSYASPRPTHILHSEWADDDDDDDEEALNEVNIFIIQFLLFCILNI